MRLSGVPASRSFNSRLREEATVRLEFSPATEHVSTHASVRRRPGCASPAFPLPAVSTHASVRRRHGCAMAFGANDKFQLTPP